MRAVFYILYIVSPVIISHLFDWLVFTLDVTEVVGMLTSPGRAAPNKVSPLSLSQFEVKSVCSSVELCRGAGLVGSSSSAVSFPIIPMITLITQTHQPYYYNTKTYNQPHTTGSPTDQFNPSSFTFFKQRRCQPVIL